MVKSQQAMDTEEVTFSFGVSCVWCIPEWVNTQQLDNDTELIERELGFLTPTGSKDVYDHVTMADKPFQPPKNGSRELL